MKFKDLSGKNTQDLYQIIGDLKRELFNIRILKGIGQAESAGSTAKVRMIRRDIARVQTALSSNRLKKEIN
jgi:ribosomal protein L29